MPKRFDEFVSRIALDITEIIQDIPNDIERQSDSYSRYKSRRIFKIVTCVAPSGALVYSGDLYIGCTSSNTVKC